MRSLLREPLLHFLLIGAALFVTFDLVGRKGGAGREKILVSAGQVAAVTAEFTLAWRRPPTPEESEGMVQDLVRDEIYYREALALGLDKDDEIIRRRLRQKLEFVSQDPEADYRRLLEKYSVVIER